MNFLSCLLHWFCFTETSETYRTQRLHRMIKSNRILVFFGICLVYATSSSFVGAFVVPSAITRVEGACRPRGISSSFSTSLSVFGGDDNSDESESENKFDMVQRIESLKSVVLGALSGGIALTPIAYLHYVMFSEVPNSAQWEFTTDMSSLEAALFAIVYRYAVRANDNNPMLNQGVVGAFVVVRTLANIQVTDICQSVPLRCKWDEAINRLERL